MLKSLVGDQCDVRYIGTRIWKYDEEDDEYDPEDHEHEDHGYGDHEHGDHGHGDHDDEEDVEMFYHLITFK